MSYVKFIDADNEKVMTAYFNSRVERIYRFSELEDIIKKAITKMDAASDAYQSQGSGWVIFGVENICLKIAKYNPMSHGRN